MIETPRSLDIKDHWKNLSDEIKANCGIIDVVWWQLENCGFSVVELIELQKSLDPWEQGILLSELEKQDDRGRHRIAIIDPGPKSPESLKRKLDAGIPPDKIFDRYRMTIVCANVGALFNVQQDLEKRLLRSGFLRGLSDEERTMPDGRVVLEANPIEWAGKSRFSAWFEDYPFEFVWNYRVKTGEAVGDRRFDHLHYGNPVPVDANIEIRLGTALACAAMFAPHGPVSHKLYQGQ